MGGVLKGEVCAATVAPSVDGQTQHARSQPWVASRGQTGTVDIFVGLYFSRLLTASFKFSSQPVITAAFFMSLTLFIGPSLARLLLHIRMGSRCVTGHVHL